MSADATIKVIKDELLAGDRSGVRIKEAVRRIIILLSQGIKGLLKRGMGDG